MDEKKEREEALKKAKELMSGYDTIIDFYDMTFIYISEESAKMSGYTSKEMIDQPISKFMTINPESEEFRKVIQGTVSGEATIPIKTKSGEEIKVPMSFLTVKVGEHPFLVTKAAKD